MHLLRKNKYILFNFYCDSSSFLITKQKVDLLVAKVKEYADKAEYKVVLVGSKTDKDNDTYIYDFDHIDLRGQTTVLDIFALAQNPNVEHYIGFDAFVMHVFSLMHKTSFVVFRGRLSARQHKMLEQYHVHLFKNDNYVQLISGKES
jgi:ADP-heptose:LPS heptosyltransferase